MNPTNYYKDLQEYIQALERQSLLIRVTRPINKDTEMHPLVRWQFRGLTEDQRKAFLFENIYDSQDRKYEMPVLIGGLAASQRIYGVGLMCGEDEVNHTWAYALEHPIEPVLLKSGPRRIIYTGSRLTASNGLLRLPIPISTPGFDNGPYLTAGCWITKDPESGIRNMGVYRGQIKGRLKTGVSWGSLNNCAMHWEKCNKRGVPLEAAVVIGGPPCIAYAGVQTVPYGVDELAVAGGLAKRPIELVKCETVDLEVPAYADLVIEGRIPSDYLEPDGPFGESHGYMDTGDLTGVFEVTAITEKPDAVFVSMISQVTPSESSKVKQSAYEASALRLLKQDLGLPVLRVALCEDLLNRQLIVIQTDRASAEDRWRAMEALLQSRGLQKIVICVDPDIDPYDLLSVNWAIANRSQPHRDLKIIPDRPLPWNPIRYVADGKRYDAADSALLIDATSKADFPPVALPRREFMENARRIWEELGLPQLTPRPPWSGYSLGHWSEEASVQADNAAAGNFQLNANYSASKGVKVPKGSSFIALKKKFLAQELEDAKNDEKAR
ncbi:MAG TPA: UbiD family decarboxylase [Candidatus Binatia bacterium]